jgi:hypothetical protein
VLEGVPRVHRLKSQQRLADFHFSIDTAIAAASNLVIFTSCTQPIVVHSSRNPGVRHIVL